MSAARVMTFRRIDGLYDWRMVGANGVEMVGTVQGYTREGDAYRALTQVRDVFCGLDPAEVVRAGTLTDAITPPPPSPYPPAED